MNYVKLEYSGRLFVIGDIHGCFYEVSVLLDHLIKKENLTVEDQIVFVGDYIDRGPDSFKVVSQLIELKENFPKTVFLRGNHEDMFLDYLGKDGKMGEAFLFNGGIDTLGSYNLDLSLFGEKLATAMPESHLAFFMNLGDLAYDDNFIIVHAGLDPLRDFEDQTTDDLFWIREDFINNSHGFGKTVVFGHTPQEQIFFDLPYKIGIDTGCCFGNMLTCCNLTERRIYQISVNNPKIIKDNY